ncbi:hypothetical protein GCM10023063_24760 [Arthrobacter methylotrophus]|uniref:Uncharacterized protein n=1 Tax=Arthrobacter methylotrophus TaxID=121291 RepID=A0ABV5UPY0_9MICC
MKIGISSATGKAGRVLVPSGGQRPGGTPARADSNEGVSGGQGRGSRQRVGGEQEITTRGNLAYSVALLAEKDIQGPLLVCTNNHRVLRAALLSRQQKINAKVVGAPIAKNSVPSAFLREFVAVMKENRLTNIVLCLPMFGIAPLITVALTKLPVVQVLLLVGKPGGERVAPFGGGSVGKDVPLRG